MTDENGDPINLSGYTASSAIKKWYTSSNSISFDTSINSNTGVVTLFLNANTSANLVPGRYVYDVDVVQASTGVVSRVVEGYVTVTPAVTAITNPSPNNNIFPNGTPLT